MKKRIYKKPFMATEEFDPNFCTTPCQKDTLLIFDESSFYKKLYYDYNPENDKYDEGEMVADYNDIPTSIIIDLKENEWPEGFYLYGKFINYATARNFYIKIPYTRSDRRGTVYAAKDKTGNYYYFSSRPTTRDIHS